MTGPEHYREAEAALETAAEEAIGSKGERYQLDKAQVHAILALAAAIALSNQHADGIASAIDAILNRSVWQEVAGRPPSIKADQS